MRRHVKNQWRSVFNTSHLKSTSPTGAPQLRALPQAYAAMSSLAASIAAPAMLASRASASRRGRARLASRANDAGARRVARVNRATRAVASPSLPSTPLDSLPVPDFLRGPLSDIVRNVETALPDDAKDEGARRA